MYSRKVENLTYFMQTKLIIWNIYTKKGTHVLAHLMNNRNTITK